MKAKLFFLFTAVLAVQVANSTQCSFQAYTPSSTPTGTTSVIVNGDAQGNDFNANTRVVIKCNSDNVNTSTQPAEVNARIATFSQSTLPFSATCEYPPNTQDTTYRISTVLLPHNIKCTSQEQSSIAIEIKALQNTTARSNSTATSNTILQRSLNASEYMPTTISTDTYAASKPQSNNVQFTFDSSWSLIGLPANGFAYDGCTYDSSNKVKIYYYDASTQSFTRTAILSPSPYLTGRGYAVKTEKPCSFETKQSKWLATQTLNLQKGWNLISIQTGPNTFSNIFDAFTVKNNCEVTSGPWMYNSKYKKYYKQRGFTPNVAYWIKVSSPCTISTSEDALPPELPVS